MASEGLITGMECPKKCLAFCAWPDEISRGGCSIKVQHVVSLLSKGQNTLPNTTFISRELERVLSFQKTLSRALTSELSRVGGASAPRSNPWRGANSFATPSPLVFRVYSLYFFVFFFVFFMERGGRRTFLAHPRRSRRKSVKTKEKKDPVGDSQEAFFPTPTENTYRNTAM